MKKKLSFEEELFQHAEIADIDGRENHSAASLMTHINACFLKVNLTGFCFSIVSDFMFFRMRDLTDYPR